LIYLMKTENKHRMSHSLRSSYFWWGQKVQAEDWPQHIKNTNNSPASCTQHKYKWNLISVVLKITWTIAILSICGFYLIYYANVRVHAFIFSKTIYSSWSIHNVKGHQPLTKLVTLTDHKPLEHGWKLGLQEKLMH